MGSGKLKLKLIMKLKFFFAAIAVLGFAVAANSQEVEMPKYQRSSLHMVLLTTDEPTLEGEDFTAQLDASWQAYPFPDKYNKHLISYTQGYGGAPKGSLIELIVKYRDGFDGLTLADAKELMESLTNPKEYNANLVAAIENIVAEQKIGNELIRKWFNIQPDGSYDLELLNERASYNASQTDVAEANATVRGVQAILDRGDDLIGNTFVTFSKLAFYPTEPVAAFTCNLAKFIASQLPGPAQTIATLAADATYAATKEGYTARTTTALYQLDWTEEVKNAFYEMFTADNKIDMEKFNAYSFPMSLVGIDNANSTTIDAGSGLASIVGAEVGRPQDQLIQQTIIRNIDKLFVKLQKSYEVFAPVSQIVSVDPLMADMGMKEGLEGGEAFNLLEPVLNPETNEIEWKSIGVVKVDKKGIWDNRYTLTEEAPAEDGELKGTVLSANKKAAVGMVVKQVVKAKK